MEQDSESATPPNESSQPASATVGVGTASDGKERDDLVVKRRSIKKLMRDASLSEKDRRLKIQALMDGSSNSSSSSLTTASLSTLGSSPGSATGSFQLSGTKNSMGLSARSVLSLDLGHNSLSNISASEEAIMSCVHYEAKCNIVAPCCNRVFGCRVCHDEMTPQDHPAMDRFQVREVVCKECHTRQDRSNQCIKCGVTFAEYHCNLCNIWMDLAKEPFHCHKCGFCRVGGAENFKHCDECCMCISNALYEHHNCLKDKYKNNCPVCREDMHTSRLAAQELPCGHVIHTHCLRSLAGFDYRCPICKKSVVNHEDMHDTWERRAIDIAQQPMPDDLKKKVTILCNECEMRSEDQDWHFLGVRCPGCGSFNTVVHAAANTTDDC